MIEIIKIAFSQKRFPDRLPWEKIIIVAAIVLASLATSWSFIHGWIIAYGDAESHLNIAKRVVSGLTPGLAQLGGVWLPLPHLLMIPLVIFDPLWRTGLAGSIVSGISFVISAFFVFKLIFLITKNKLSAAVGSLIFITNPNMLYMQSTPMTELPLIVFSLASIYYFCLYFSENGFRPLMLAGGFGLAASLSRYDGWFLVTLEALIIFLHRFPFRKFGNNLANRSLTFFTFLTDKGEGELILFSTLAFIGIVGWLLWGYLILGNPLYFAYSSYSAASQQKGFLALGELPAYHNLWVSFLYYFVTSMSVGGILIFGSALIASVIFLRDKAIKNRWFIYLLFLSPFIFNVVTLFLGQSVIYIPGLNLVRFKSWLFNVRYGLLMVPAMAVLFGYLFGKVSSWGKVFLITLLIVNLGFFATGYSPVLTLAEGTLGISKSSHPDAENWLSQHYDYGLVLMDDYGRAISIIGSGIPMQDIVYVGSRFYWQEALQAPQLRIRWVVMQKNDAVWKALYSTGEEQGRLYKYFRKVYSSESILIFERNNQ
jgi:hypothetical protein